MFGRFLLFGWTVLVHEYCSSLRGTPLGCGFITTEILFFCFVSDSLLDLSNVEHYCLLLLKSCLRYISFIHYIFLSFCKALLRKSSRFVSNSIRFVRIDFEMKTLREKKHVCFCISVRSGTCHGTDIRATE